MIRHLFKLVWNRKRVNFMITVEIFFSFLVLFAVVMLGVSYLNNYLNPLGFKYENILNVSIDVKQTTDDVWTPEQVETTRQLYLAAKEFKEVESVASIYSPPFSFSSSSGGFEIDGKSIRYERNETTDDLKDVLDLDLIRGRWFGREDNGSTWEPVVINQRLAREMFGDEDPIGRNANHPREKEEWRVIGVVSDFRRMGEFSPLGNSIFYRKNMNNPEERPLRNMVIKLRPGVTAEFEARLMSKLQNVAKEWSFEIEQLTEMRKLTHQIFLTPVIVGGTIAGFMILMVVLGLTGVLWQNVTQRTKEIGLRRAKGATRGRIYNQILGELLLITTFGVVFGTAVVIQFPLLDLVGSISGKSFVYSLFISMVLIYALTFICGLYPARLATKVQPAEALHYE